WKRATQNSAFAVRPATRLLRSGGRVFMYTPGGSFALPVRGFFPQAS
ncbi:MAG: hypothetical protein AVDCRST_MAG56-3159, partial [uncultured Cytophagales bacterium]